MKLSGHTTTIEVRGETIAVRCECGWGESAPARVGRELETVQTLIMKHGKRESLLAKLAVLIGPKKKPPAGGGIIPAGGLVS